MIRAELSPDAAGLNRLENGQRLHEIKGKEGRLLYRESPAGSAVLFSIS